MNIDEIQNESIKTNIRRKQKFIDVVSYIDGIPMPTWIDINPTELCNRKCVFCPRVDESVYPNQKLHFNLDLAEKIASELQELNYKGAVTFSGYGEPLLHPKIDELCHKFVSKGIRVEIVTNGDKLSVALINRIVAKGNVFFAVSMYDGPHQIKAFQDILKASNLAPDYWLLRDRWYAEDKDFGLKLTNRAGVQKIKGDRVTPVGQPCFYPSYSMTIDWNGDVLLCVQDWNKRVKFGNLALENIWDIWTSTYLSKYRNANLRGERKLSPCNSCTANGCIHGANHAEAFAKTAK